MKYQFIAVLAAIAMMSGTVGLATAADDGVFRLGEVVVSGEKTGVEAIGTTHKVTAADIEKRGARSLNEAINMLPGVQVRTAADGAPRIDMRGFRTRHVKLLLNGTPFHGTNDGQFDPALISVENIAEIVVTTGGGSELYGSGGNAGVINIITKKGTKGAHGSVGTELSEVDASLLRATGSYGTEKFDMFVSASYYEREAYRLSNHYGEEEFEGGDERENSDRDRKNLFANLGYQPTDATLLGLTFSYLKGERGKMPSALEGYNKKKKSGDTFAKTIKYQRQEDEELNVQLAASHNFAGPLSVKGWAYFNTLDSDEKEYDETYTTLNRGKSVYSETEISGANLQLAYDLQDNGRATLGLMVEDDDYEAEDGDGVKLDSGDFQLYSASLEYEVAPLDKLGVVLGAGAHWQDRESDTEQDFSYLVGLTYDLFDGTRLKASHARKVRFPTLRDLYDTEDGTINDDLTAETTWHYEAGIEQVLPAKTLLSLTGFYIDIEDYIEKDADDVRRNYEEYEFYGVEVAAENRYFDRLFLRASYSYMSAEDKSSDTERDELQYRPEHKVTLESTCNLLWGMTAYAGAQYIANSYHYNYDETEQDELSDIFLVDFKLNKSAANGAIDLYLGIDNVFDEDYEQSYGFPLAGRTFYGGATWKF